MKKYTKLLALLLALAMVFSVLAACSKGDDGSASAGSGDSAQQPAGNGSSDSAPSGGDSAPSGGSDSAPAGGGEAVDHTLVIGTTISNDTFDPYTQSNYELQCRMIYDSLVEVNENGEIIPWLAESWEYIDECTLKLTLRDEVYFTDGQKLCANDVIASLKLQLDALRQPTYLDMLDWDKTYADPDDDLVLWLGFNTPYGGSLSYLVVYSIFCAEDIENNTPDDWMSHPNGTSAYYLTENVPGSIISYQRKDAENYWGELPECEAVSYRYYADTTTMYIDFESGNLDAAYGLNPQDAERVLAGNCPDFVGYNLVSQKDVLRIQLCETTEVFQDPAVREAFSLALDTAGMATANYSSLWLPATSTIASNVQFYVNCGEHEYNPEKAKQILADAGYSDGDINVRVVCTIDNQDLAATMQAYLAAVGINLTVETYDLGVLIGMWRDGESDVLVQQTIGGAFFSDPVIVYANNAPDSRTRIMAFTDPEWVEAYENATYHTDPAVRTEAYADMQHYLVDGYHLIPVCETAELVVFNTNKIKDYHVSIPKNPRINNVEFVG